jgi:hypothetical protein
MHNTLHKFCILLFNIIILGLTMSKLSRKWLYLWVTAALLELCDTATPKNNKYIYATPGLCRSAKSVLLHIVVGLYQATR